jgi:alpha-glucosidase
MTLTAHGRSEHQDNDVDELTTSTDWRRGVIYQIYPRSFADGNGDGMGDLTGAIDRLGYLASLGVDAIWVSPWFVSPMADGGYDVADYCDIHPMFGTLADAEAFIAACHERNMKVMIDLVANHCSSEHRWFKAALASEPGSAQRDWFYFRDGRGVDGNEPPTDWVSVFGGRAWTRTTNPDGTPGQWYLHLFDHSQPDLNWNNPAVRAAFDEIFRFWFDRGVDGFRLDAVPAIGKDRDFEDAGCDQNGQFTPETSEQTRYWDAGDVHEIVAEWRTLAESHSPPKYLIGEINVSTPEALLRYIRPGELQSVFAMNLTKASWNARVFEELIRGNLNYPHDGESWPTWILSSHDEVRTVTRFAQLANGNSDLATGERRARAAMLLTLALPGSACLYQGEELGLPQVQDLPRALLEDPIVARTGNPLKGRDGCRVALPWTTDGPSFGFGAAAPRLPQPDTWGAISVAAQEADANSFLAFTRAALRERHRHIAHQTDACTWESWGENVLAFARGPLVCVVNFGDTGVALPETAEIVLASAPLEEGYLAADAAVWMLR